MGKKQEGVTRDCHLSGQGEFPMQFIALDATTIVPGDGARRLAARTQLRCREEFPQASQVLHTRLYLALDSGGGFSSLRAPVGESLADEDRASGVTGWKRAITWTGAAIAGWAMVFACVAIIRALVL